MASAASADGRQPRLGRLRRLLNAGLRLGQVHVLQRGQGVPAGGGAAVGFVDVPQGACLALAPGEGGEGAVLVGVLSVAFHGRWDSEAGGKKERRVWAMRPSPGAK